MSLKPKHAVLLHDVLVAAISFVLSLYLRLGREFEDALPFLLPGMVIFSAVCGAVFVAFRMHRSLWRYTSSDDLLALVRAVTVSILLFLPAMFLYNRLEGFPRSMLAINWLVLMALLGAPRMATRIWYAKSLSLSKNAAPSAHRLAVLLAGVNDQTEMFLRDVQANIGSGFDVVGFMDEDAAKAGASIRGVRVMGKPADLPRICTKLNERGHAPQKVIYSPEHTSGSAVRKLVELANSEGLTVARLPRLTDLQNSTGLGGDVQKIAPRPVAVEDLLGRAQVPLDKEGMKHLVSGKRVLVTGAGGTIGSELVRQLAQFQPSHMTLVDHAEHNLYLIDHELCAAHKQQSFTPIIGDVKNRALMETVMRREKPDLVFHAAALKHVPMSEVNTEEAVLTNVLGTRNIADLCAQLNVSAMVMISTDKAVNPTNVMGATKRAAESYIQALGQSGRAESTRFITVRFGNVLGSTGSVIPLFARQLEQGGPLTVTHKDVTRYFMTVREAVELVLQASVLGGQHAGGTSHVYVLDMGEPVRISDLAEQMIRLAGFKPGQDIKIEYIGLRPGEKLFEELFYDAEALKPTECKGIMQAATREASMGLLEGKINALLMAATSYNRPSTIKLLRDVVPEFTPESDDYKQAV